MSEPAADIFLSRASPESIARLEGSGLVTLTCPAEVQGVEARRAHFWAQIDGGREGHNARTAEVTRDLRVTRHWLQLVDIVRTQGESRATTDFIDAHAAELLGGGEEARAVLAQMRAHGIDPTGVLVNRAALMLQPRGAADLAATQQANAEQRARLTSLAHLGLAIEKSASCQ
ncbi:MAG: hypothetical protein Q7V62_14340 [Actinomycetota bacterium]|nr:hypothetical protein [Actinomycetota bacterium]